MQVLGSEARHELLAAVVVVDAVGEPEALQVDLEGAEGVGLAVYGEVGIDRLERLADQEIVLAVLVEGDVAAVKGSLGETVDETLLLERQLLETVKTVSEHLHIGKTLVEIVDCLHGV